VAEPAFRKFEIKLLFRNVLPDGRVVGLWRWPPGWRITVAKVEEHFDDWWCYDSVMMASEAFRRWDGVGEPIGWVGHPQSGRLRPSGNPDTEMEPET